MSDLGYQRTVWCSAACIGGFMHALVSLCRATCTELVPHPQLACARIALQDAGSQGRSALAARIPAFQDLSELQSSLAQLAEIAHHRMQAAAALVGCLLCHEICINRTPPFPWWGHGQRGIAAVQLDPMHCCTWVGIGWVITRLGAINYWWCPFQANAAIAADML